MEEAEGRTLWATMLRSVVKHEIDTADKSKRDVLEIEWSAVLAFQLAQLLGQTEDLEALVDLINTINAPPPRNL